jgi:hypothetical protein
MREKGIEKTLFQSIEVYYMTEEKEVKKEAEKDPKEMEEQRKKFMEMQKKQMEEQKAAKKMQLEMTLKQLDVQKKITECTIDRMKADCEVIEKVDMAEEKNEVMKKALEAKLAETKALMESEELKLEMIDLNTQGVQDQLKNIDKMPMMPPGGGMMGRPPM